MAIYLIDKSYSDLAIDLANKDETIKLVFIQDGVYTDISRITGNNEIYCIDRDLELRGIENPSERTKIINYEELVDLIVSDDVINFI
jgi:sulfur relay protein TusB/DsrH